MAADPLVSSVARLDLNARDTLKTPHAHHSTKPKLPFQPFRLLDLPSEIRIAIYGFTLFAKPGKHIKIRRRKKGIAPRLSLLLVSRRVHDEAAHVFYTSQVFRMFFVQDFQPLPTIRDLPRSYRQLVTSVELVLGPGWTAPPKDWKVTPALGLQDLVRVQKLQVFVEIDPSHPSLAGFRVSHDFYTNFAGKLLHDVLAAMPAVEYVQIDSNPSVQRTGPLITRLLLEATAAQCKMGWGSGPKGRATNSAFVAMISKIEPWLAPKFPGRMESDLPYLVPDNQGNYVLSAPSKIAVPSETETAQQVEVDHDLSDPSTINDRDLAFQTSLEAFNSTLSQSNYIPQFANGGITAH